MLLFESLAELFESKSNTDYKTLILKAAESIHNDGRMVWSRWANTLVQDKAVMDRVSAVAGKFAKSADERDEIIQDFFVNKFGSVLRSAAASIKQDKYTAKQFLTLLGIAVKQHYYNMKRGAGRRSSHERQKAAEIGRAQPESSKRYGGASQTRFGHYSDDQKLLVRAVSDVISGAKDDKTKAFLTAYFGLDKGRLTFSGNARDALKRAGLDPKSNAPWASRRVKDALGALRDNAALRKVVAAESKEGIVQSRMLHSVIDEGSNVADKLFVEWLTGYFRWLGNE